MKKISPKWTSQLYSQQSQEQIILRKLVSKQWDIKRVGWKEISNELHKTLSLNRSPKQCRERFVNYLKLEQNASNRQWSNEQISQIQKLYQANGPCWSFLVKKLVPSNTFLDLQSLSKYQKQIQQRFQKNFISFKKCSDQNSLYQRTEQKKQMVSHIMNFTNKLLKSIKNENFSPNLNSRFFKLRSKLIKLALGTLQLQELQLFDIVKQVKRLNGKIKGFGIFKLQSIKNWRLNLGSLMRIYKFDKVIMQQFPQKIKHSCVLQQITKIECFLQHQNEVLESKIGSLQGMDSFNYDKSRNIHEEMLKFDRQFYRIIGVNLVGDLQDAYLFD